MLGRERWPSVRRPVLAPRGPSERATTTAASAATSARSRRYDATDGRDLDRLVAIVKKRGDGRVYAGLRGNWGRHYKVGSVPVHAWLADRDVDAIGFTFRTIASLSTDVEVASTRRTRRSTRCSTSAT